MSISVTWRWREGPITGRPHKSCGQPKSRKGDIVKCLLGFLAALSTLVFLVNPLYPYTLDWDWQPEPRWLTGVDVMCDTFFGGICLGENFFGSILTPDQYVSVEIRFDSSDTTICARYERPGYLWVGDGVFRGSAWDISDPGTPRRLNICLTEWVDSGICDGLWNPDTTDVGGREYLFIMLSDYNESIDYDNDNWGLDLDVVYGCWLRLIPGHALYESDPAVLTIYYCEPSRIEPAGWGRIKGLFR